MDRLEKLEKIALDIVKQPLEANFEIFSRLYREKKP